MMYNRSSSNNKGMARNASTSASSSMTNSATSASAATSAVYDNFLLTKPTDAFEAHPMYQQNQRQSMQMCHTPMESYTFQPAGYQVVSFMSSTGSTVAPPPGMHFKPITPCQQPQAMHFHQQATFHQSQPLHTFQTYHNPEQPMPVPPYQCQSQTMQVPPYHHSQKRMPTRQSPHSQQVVTLPPNFFHPKFKTEICNKYQLETGCPYGDQCQFRHPDDVVSPNGTTIIVTRSPRFVHPTRSNGSVQFREFTNSQLRPLMKPFNSSGGRSANSRLNSGGDSNGVRFNFSGARVQDNQVPAAIRRPPSHKFAQSQGPPPSPAFTTIKFAYPQPQKQSTFTHSRSSGRSSNGGRVLKLEEMDSSPPGSPVLLVSNLSLNHLPPVDEKVNMSIHHLSRVGALGEPSNYKTRMCENISTTAGCRYGKKCHFRHPEDFTNSDGNDSTCIAMTKKLKRLLGKHDDDSGDEQEAASMNHSG